MDLERLAWLITTGTCLIAAMVLLVEGYLGYAGVLAAVGASAAINLR